MKATNPINRYWLLLLGLLLGGCATSQTQTLYFAAADANEPNPTIKFYRVKIETHAFNKTTQFVPGYYDATALRALFGTVDPSNGPNLKDNTVSFQVLKTGQLVRSGNESLFAIFYGADAHALANQVSSLASSTGIATALAGFMGANLTLAQAARTKDAVNNAAAALKARQTLVNNLTALAALAPIKASSPAPAPAPAPAPTVPAAPATPPTPTVGDITAAQKATLNQLAVIAQAQLQALGSSFVLDKTDPVKALQQAQTALDVMVAQP